MGIALFSSLGLPGLNGFVGEFLIFRGAFPLATWATALAVIGLLVTAIFILTILQRVFSGPLNEKWSEMPDLTISGAPRAAASNRNDVRLGFIRNLCSVISSTACSASSTVPMKVTSD